MRNTFIVTALVALVLLTVANGWSTSGAGEGDTITAAAQNYMDAYYTADVGRMQQVLHPQFHKRTLTTVNDQLEVQEDTIQSMLEGVRSGSGQKVPHAERVQQIEVLDVYKDAASVKVITGRWIDYMHLSKVNGDWRVLDVVLQYTRK